MHTVTEKKKESMVLVIGPVKTRVVSRNFKSGGHKDRRRLAKVRSRVELRKEWA